MPTFFRTTSHNDERFINLDWIVQVRPWPTPAEPGGPAPWLKVTLAGGEFLIIDSPAEVASLRAILGGAAAAAA